MPIFAFFVEYDNKKTEVNMKKQAKILIFLCLLFIISLSFLLSGCEEKGKVQKKQEIERTDYLIITKEGGIEEHTAKYAAAELSERGFTWKLLYEGQSFDNISCKGIILSGCDVQTEYDVPLVVMRFDADGHSEGNVISPAVSPDSIARAAVLLFPEAEHYALISSAEGAADVQDACDCLDMCGVNYTVEALDGRAYGDAVFSAAKKGCDVLILPSGDEGGSGIDLAQYGTAVVAVGKGEPVRGAAASFCIDTEKMAKAASELCISLSEGKDLRQKEESYYALCISESALESLPLTADMEAVSEDFKVVLVE